MSEERYYVKNADLLPEIISYKETGVISEELGKMIMAIATNYSNKGSFYSYTWKDDMVMEGVLTVLKYIHNFSPEKQRYPNPFAYCTTIIHNSFLNFLKKQKRHSSIKDQCYKNHQNLQDDFYIIKGIDYTRLKDDK